MGTNVTVYEIAPGRGFDDAAAILGEDFAGALERGGWVPCGAAFKECSLGEPEASQDASTSSLLESRWVRESRIFTR